MRCLASKKKEEPLGIGDENSLQVEKDLLDRMVGLHLRSLTAMGHTPLVRNRESFSFGLFLNIANKITCLEQACTLEYNLSEQEMLFLKESQQLFEGKGVDHVVSFDPSSASVGDAVLHQLELGVAVGVGGDGDLQSLLLGLAAVCVG